MDPMKNVLTALLLSGALVLAGCGSDSSSRSGGDSGSNASSNSGDTGGASRATQIQSPTAADGTARTFDEATDKFMQDGLRQFGKGDPAWTQTRAKWLAMGSREQRFLVSAMFAVLIKAQRGGYSDLVQGARHELVLIGTPSIDFMAGILATGTVDTVYDEIAEEEKAIRVDDDVRREAAEVLALIGAPAAPATVEAADSAETKSGKRFALQALGNMGDRGGAAAVNGLIDWSQSDDWVLRVDAVAGLRGFSDQRSRRALERALEDEESLVRQKAAESLLARREKSSLPYLRRAQAKAKSAGKLVESRRFERIVRTIEAAEPRK